MPGAIVIGGGLAGMAAALALREAGFEVEIFEAGRESGGRAGSMRLAETGEWVDAGQHILLGCCRNLLDFFRRLGVEHLIRFYDHFIFIEPGGTRSRLPAAGSTAMRLLGLLRLRFLRLRDKLAVVRAIRGVRRELALSERLDAVSMAQWLESKQQTPRARTRFWRPLLVSALNEEPERVSAWHGLQLIWLTFLAGSEGARLGVPAVPLSELYGAGRWQAMEKVTLRLGARVGRLHAEGNRVAALEADGLRYSADFYVLATPADRARALMPELELPVFETSPIVVVHLWFDRPVMDVDQAALLDRTIQWAFNKREGRYVQLVISAARGLLPLAKDAIVRMAVGELAEYFPQARGGRLARALVVKHLHATFAPLPGLRRLRPAAETRWGNLFLAGDWTATGWPATMEGAVRSGYLAAEAVTRAANVPRRFLIPDPMP